MKRGFDFDLVVIGSGSAGFAAARTAAALGARTAVIEASRQIAGLCILRGCMPSKTLLASSGRMHAIATAREFGIEGASGRPNLSRVVARKKRLVREFAGYREEQIRKGRFRFIRGRPVFVDPNTVRLENGRKIRARFFVICTGSKIASVPVPGLAAVRPMVSDSALNRTCLPQSLIVLGGGPVALELGQYFHRMGSRVTILQRSPHILSKSDVDLADGLADALRAEGVRVLTGVTLLGFETRRGLKAAVFSRAGETHRIEAVEVLQALGRSPNTAGLGLEAIGLKLRGSAIAVDRAMRSSVPNIYAAGDVNGEHEVVHIAIRQAELAAGNALLGRKEKFDERTKAFAVFTDPEVASVGFSERELEGRRMVVAKYPFADHGKSIVMGETRGFVKIIAEPRRGTILGAQILGPHASDLIHEMIAFIHLGATAGDVAAMPHYHPTLAEILTYPAEEIAGIIGRRRA